MIHRLPAQAERNEEAGKTWRDGGRIEDFVASQVIGRGLNGRTAVAYRQDLEQLHAWLKGQGMEGPDEAAVESCLDYLARERKLKVSTVTRKYRVFRCYLEYLARQGLQPAVRPIALPAPEEGAEEEAAGHGLSKAEVDAFFTAMNREYDGLDSDFRKRVCLRDNVMMELLFYHGLEVSQLLRLETSHYAPSEGILSLPGKKGKRQPMYLFSRELRGKMGQWMEERTYFKRDNEYQDRLFLSKMGRPLSMKMVILVFEKYRSMAGIEKESTPKDLKCSMKKYAQEMLVERCR